MNDLYDLIPREVANLSKSALRELGGDTLRFVITIDQDGNIKLFKSAQGEVKVLTDTDLPMKGADINRILAWSITSYEDADKSFVYYCGGSRGTRCCRGPDGSKICPCPH